MYIERMYFDAVDALFAVYEASSLELWYFMATVAISGSPRSVGIIAVFHISLVLFLVFLVQVSFNSGLLVWINCHGHSSAAKRISGSDYRVIC